MRHNGPIRIGLVEDEAETCRAIADAIAAAGDMALVATAASREEALHCLGRYETDVLLVDLGLPDGSGLDVIGAAAVRWPDCAILVSTIFGDEASILRAIEAGAAGYLLKDIEAGELVGEIRTAHAGGSSISPMVARLILGRVGYSEPPRTAPPQPVDLSSRELDVLKLIGKGFMTKEVAHILGISDHTVLTFVRRIYRKLGVNSRIEAAAMARRMGLLRRA
ncbi:MAG: response regulator transcription factor [Novosphingobium sp.]|jgi:DNA-binding NarL/FixJ family response regulator|nr:response regulator transcription factor [Novosphingobium sp.]